MKQVIALSICTIRSDYHELYIRDKNTNEIIILKIERHLSNKEARVVNNLMPGNIFTSYERET